MFDRKPNLALSSGFKGATTTFDEQTMTYGGTFTKMLILFLLLLGGAYVEVIQSPAGGGASMLLLPALFIGLGLALYTVFNPTRARFTAPLYAFCEGVVLAGVSLLMEVVYPGVALPAIVITLGIAAAMLGLYSARILKNSPAFTKGMLGATGGVLLIYLVSGIASLFGAQVPLLHSLISGGGWISVGFSFFVVGLASLSLVLDFDYIETQVEKGAPRTYEWYGAFGIMVTLVWLYLEVLRLLVNLRSVSDD